MTLNRVGYRVAYLATLLALALLSLPVADSKGNTRIFQTTHNYSVLLQPAGEKMLRPVPVGVVDRGMYYDAKARQLLCYHYMVREVIGVAYISMLNGYSLEPYGRRIKPGELSLQLNLYVKARTLDNKQHLLWIQDIYVLKSPGDGLYYIIDDEVHNITIPGIEIVQSGAIKGRGSIIHFGQYKIYQYYNMTWRVIAKPFKPVLLFLHVRVDGNKIYFAHGYFVNESSYFYEVQDEVTLTGYKDLTIVVNGCNFTVKPLSIELIIGGRDAIYQLFVAKDVDVELTLLIKNETLNRVWTPPPAAWTTSVSPAEKTLNVASIPQAPAIARLVNGIPAARELWSRKVSSKIILPNPKIYITESPGKTPSIHLTSIKVPEKAKTYKVGPLLVVLVKTKTGVHLQPQYRIISVATAALTAAIAYTVYYKRRRLG